MPAGAEDFVVRFAVPVFICPGFAWSLQQKTSTRLFGASFRMKLSHIRYQTCREYRIILSPLT